MNWVVAREQGRSGRGADGLDVGVLQDDPPFVVPGQGLQVGGVNVRVVPRHVIEAF